MNKRNSIQPGKPWLDTEGKRIQAHGGAVYYEDGTYYWYGENKEKTDGNGTVWTWGIRAYASEDLYNWRDLGLIIHPDIENKDSSLYPAKKIDRPHIIYNEKTGKYVCWLKLSGEEACFVVLTSDAFLGPYKMDKNKYRPFGFRIGDFDLIQDENTKKAYLYVDICHESIACLELSEDYTSVEKMVCKSYEDLQFPLCREAPALFENGGQKYMLTSGVTGYAPNKSDAAISERWDTVFHSIGDPHVNDKSGTSFNSQISKIFRVEGKKNLYIAMADRWLPDYYIDARYSDIIKRGIGTHIMPGKFSLTENEKKEFERIPMIIKTNTSIADYVWLPVKVENNQVQIQWYDEWRIEDF